VISTRIPFTFLIGKWLVEILKSQIVEEILKRQMAAKFTVEKNSIPDF